MPKKNAGGGKKYKKAKNHVVLIEAPLELKTDNQSYACITKLLGHGRVYCNVYSVELIDGSPSFNASERLGIIRGAMRKKKQWVKNGDIVIVSIRDYQDDKVDILYVYTHDNAKKLMKKNQLPNIDFDENQSENMVDFNDIDSEDDTKVNIIETMRGDNITQVSYIPDEESYINEI
jgi:translation initiation factor 1A